MRSTAACGIFCTWLGIGKETLGTLTACGSAAPGLLTDVLPVELSHRGRRPTLQPFEEFGFQRGKSLALLISPDEIAHILAHARIAPALHLLLDKRFELLRNGDIHGV